jgi:hypothetical protein
MDHQKRSPDVSWVTSSRQTDPELQGRLELNLVWSSIFIRAPSLILHASKPSSMCLLDLSFIPKHNIIIR